MSTTPVTPVSAEQVTVNMPKEQIAAAVPTPTQATAPPALPVAPTPANPFVVHELPGGKFQVEYLEGGEKFEGSAAEVIAKTAQAHINTKNWARTEVEKYKQQPPVTPVQTPPQSAFATPQEEDTARYVTELQAKFLGFKSAEEYQEALGRVQQNTEMFAGQNLSVQFAAVHPEFNGTPENSEKLLNTVESLGLTPLMVNGDPNQQLNALRAAHAFALQNKIYEPKPTAQTTTPAIPPPPIPSTGPTDLSTVPDDLKVDVNMSKEEIQRRIDLARSRNYIY